jgi:MFS transporter, OFA family, oxalate/formate antiporter
MKTSNRWTIAIAGVFLQIALGAVYAWSVFRVRLLKQEISHPAFWELACA